MPGYTPLYSFEYPVNADPVWKAAGTVERLARAIESKIAGGTAAAVNANPNTVVRRDANGRAFITDPTAAGHIASKAYVDRGDIDTLAAARQYADQSAGTEGPQGPAGPVGATGPEGPQGPAGPEGPAGPKGETGDLGPVGLTGPRGEAGPAGPEGPTGPAGPKGETGDAGPAGPEGPIGPKGDAGDTGPAGPEGTGLELAGAVPTYAELPADAEVGSTWLVSSEGAVYTRGAAGWPPAGTGGQIQGPAGPAGPKGDTGPAGPKGDTGDTGPRGPAGVEGPAGPKGDAGPIGPEGPTGDTGPAGPAGPEGPRGLKGDTGATGLTGPRGEAGATGPTGPKGDKGEAGATGLTGPKGDKGDTGPAGLDGLAYSMTVTRTSAFTVANATDTDIQFTSTSWQYDPPGGSFARTSFGVRVPVRGIYMVVSSAAFGGTTPFNTAGVLSRVRSGTRTNLMATTGPGSNNAGVLNAVTTTLLEPSDEIRFAAYQASGGSRVLDNTWFLGETWPKLTVILLRPL